MITRILVSILACLSIMSCSKELVPGTSIKCDVSDSRSISESNFVKNAKIISLQDTSITISSVNKVICRDSILYLLDDTNQSLYIYNTNGQFIRAISRQGHATNEYLKLDDFFIDDESGNINLVSQLEQKLLVYNYDGSIFLKTIRLPGKFARMICIEDGYIGYQGNYKENTESYNFCIMGRNFDVINKFLEIDSRKEFEYHTQVLPFSTYKKNVYFHNDSGLDIYSIDKNHSNPYLFCTLDCGEQNTPEYTKEDIEDFFKRMELYNKHVMEIYQFQETNEYLLFLFLYKGQFHINVYNKFSGISKTLKLDYYKDEYYFNFGKVVGMTENCIYAIVDADQIYSVWNGNENNEYEKNYLKQVRHLREKIKKVDPNGNPFLVIYYIN